MRFLFFVLISLSSAIDLKGSCTLPRPISFLIEVSGPFFLRRSEGAPPGDVWRNAGSLFFRSNPDSVTGFLPHPLRSFFPLQSPCPPPVSQRVFLFCVFAQGDFFLFISSLRPFPNVRVFDQAPLALLCGMGFPYPFSISYVLWSFI